MFAFYGKSKFKLVFQFKSAMMDQNLLDKQFILESLIDLLEKSPSGFNHHLNQQSLSQQPAQQQKALSSQLSLAQSNNPLFEYSTSKLILVTGKLCEL